MIALRASASLRLRLYRCGQENYAQYYEHACTLLRPGGPDRQSDNAALDGRVPSL